jgi:hypothetical protein
MSKRLLIGSGVVLVIGLAWGMIFLGVLLWPRPNADKDDRHRCLNAAGPQAAAPRAKPCRPASNRVCLCVKLLGGAVRSS